MEKQILSNRETKHNNLIIISLIVLMSQNVNYTGTHSFIITFSCPMAETFWILSENFVGWLSNDQTVNPIIKLKV